MPFIMARVTMMTLQRIVNRRASRRWLIRLAQLSQRDASDLTSSGESTGVTETKRSGICPGMNLKVWVPGAMPMDEMDGA